MVKGSKDASPLQAQWANMSLQEGCDASFCLKLHQNVWKFSFWRMSASSNRKHLTRFFPLHPTRMHTPRNWADFFFFYFQHQHRWQSQAIFLYWLGSLMCKLLHLVLSWILCLKEALQDYLPHRAEEPWLINTGLALTIWWEWNNSIL